MSKEIPITNFIGMMPSTRKPPLNAASYINNFDLRGIDGDLELRNGYDLAFAAFTHTYLTNPTFWDFESLYTPETDTEHFIVVGKATTISRAATMGPLLPYNIVIILDRTAAGWDWLNESIHTAISNIDPDAVGDWEIELDFADAAADYNGWTVVNISNSPETFAKVIVTGIAGSGNVKLELSAEAHGWSQYDEVMLMKNYIPFSELVQMSSLSRADVEFHRVLNDLRIGFGGQSNRMGLMVGYRKFQLQVSNCDHNTFSSGEMNTFAEYDGMMVTPHTALTEEANIDLAVVTGGTFPEGTYYFRITGVLDDQSEILLNADANITIAVSKDIAPTILLKLGPENLRLTKIKLYFADLSRVYNFIAEIPVRLRDSSTRNPMYAINESGYLKMKPPSIEMHSDGTGAQDNAASTALVSDPATTTRWLGWYTSILATTGDAGWSSVNVIRCYKTSGSDRVGCYYQSEDDFLPNTVYDIDIGIRMVTPASAQDIKFQFLKAGRTNDGEIVYINVGTGYTTYQFQLETGDAPAFFQIITSSLTGTNTEFNFDILSISRTVSERITLTTPERGSEIADEMGYTPTLNLVKCWDRAIVTQGRTWMIGTWIDKRYLNLIFFSAISGAAANMYDTCSADSLHNYDLENYDGGELLDLQVLPNLDFLGLKSNGPQRIDSFTGRGMDIDFGAGLINKKGAVNLGKNVIYPGEYDIMLANGIGTKNLSDGTIREAYRLLTDDQKAAIVATREEKDNAYRMFSGDVGVKTEYVLTKKGWISASRDKYPEAYTIARNGDILFINTGVIYRDAANKIDNDIVYNARWWSVWLDAEILDFPVSIMETLILEGFYLFYTSSIPLEINIILDYGTNLPAFNLPAGDKVKKGLSFGQPQACRAFLIKIDGSVEDSADYCNIHGVFPVVSKKSIKRHQGNAT